MPKYRVNIYYRAELKIQVWESKEAARRKIKIEVYSDAREAKED